MKMNVMYLLLIHYRYVFVSLLMQDLLVGRDQQ
jgi:hypothetical protein